MMIMSTFWSSPAAVALANHLWQSTIFTLAVWLLSLALRRNEARARYRLWMAASLKFLLPLTLLVTIGGHIPWPGENQPAQPAITSFVEGVAQPLFVAGSTPAQHATATQTPTAAQLSGHTMNWLPLLLALWTGGTVFLLARWTVQWWRLRRIIRAAAPLRLSDEIPLLLTRENIEPGVFGIMRPVLLLPHGMMEQLTPSQLDAVVTHELCHMRRRDNLTAALHMIVELLFWFHPVVWWIRARLLEERERACDEAVLASRREAVVYAEGILNVCKFCVEAPLHCVSGVTGSDLKKRIARIMAAQVAHKLDFGRKLLLTAAAALAVALPVTFGFIHEIQVHAQTAPAAQTRASKTGIEGTWQGTLEVPNGPKLRIVNKISKAPNGALTVQDYSIDQGARPMASSSASFSDGEFKYAIEFIDGSYDGKMSADGNSITGTWTQGGHSLSLVLERATPETEWTIPAPPPEIPPMAADAHPGIEVATVKPTKPDQQGKMITVRGAELVTVGFTLGDLVKFAYTLQDKQIINAPDWMSSDRFDINAKPDQPGMPNGEQLKGIVRKLLADRFALKFHNDTKEMSAYVLTVGKEGPKMKKSDADPKSLPGLFFGPIGTLHVRNATMADFTGLMQSAVLDRPVIDKTGLDGKWDFTLKWTPDETQFVGLGVKIPPPSDAADAAPPLFTAIQEQLDLKLEATKTQVPVLVIDHVDHPSPN